MKILLAITCLLATIIVVDAARVKVTIEVRDDADTTTIAGPISKIYTTNETARIQTALNECGDGLGGSLIAQFGRRLKAKIQEYVANCEWQVLDRDNYITTQQAKEALAPISED